jgi:periplasmic protein TonB
MMPDSIDLLMEDVLREVANPVPNEDISTRITTGSLAMDVVATSPSNLLMFSTLDRTVGRPMSPQSVGVAVLLNVAALLLLMVQVKTHVLTTPREIVLLEMPMAPPPAPPKLQAMGGGGGHPDSAPVSKGNPPKFAVEQLNPPKAPPLQDPKIRIESTVDVDPNLKMAKTDLLNLGMPTSPNVGTSLGSGRGTGLGSGNGSGIGPGSGGNMGGGIRRIGGGVAAPIVLFAPEPEFSEEARKAKASGNVLVYLQVDTNGRPMHVRVLRGIGLGLDEKAVDAVSHYKFKPAMENGHPVAVEMQVEVNFQIF